MEHGRPLHLRSLTGLRFYAALAVVVYHISRYFDPLRGLAPVAGFGYTGVSFFFILSGFVLAWSHRKVDTKAIFYWRRFARVWPLHGLTTAAAGVLTFTMGAAVNWAALPFVVTLTQAWVPPGTFRYAFNGVSWSLACEAFFYLLFPLLFGLLARKSRLLTVAAIVYGATVLAAVGAILVAPGEALGYLLYTMPLYRMGEFLIGLCTAIALRRGWRPRFTLTQAVSTAVVLYAVLSIAALSTIGDLSQLPYVVADLWMLPAFWAIIASAASGDIGGASGFLRSERAVKLGQWSFALYLVHELIIKAAKPTFDNLDAIPAALASCALIVTCILLAGFLYEIYERPVERWLRSRVALKESVSG